MKSPAFLALFALFLTAAGRAADPAPAAPAPSAAPASTPVPGSPNLDLPEFKTADSFWNELQRLQAAPTQQPASQQERMAILHSWFTLQKEVASAFAKKFPEDIRHWEAQMLALRASVQLRKMSGEPVSTEADSATLEAIINAPNAPVRIKGEAAFMAITNLFAEIDPAKPATFTTFHKGIEAFLAKFPDHPLTDQVKGIQFRVLSMDPTPDAVEILKKYAAGSDPRAVKAATALLQHKQKMEEMRTKPIDVKFTGTNGQPVDTANLRGKVVLLEFWASSCAPCIAEMPSFVSAYQKYHEKGFEILGICLDKEKNAMDAVLQKQGMTWPQYFDGGAWQNKVSSSLGVTYLPTAWLIDKKGMLREMSVRGDSLSAGVEKLLAE